MHKFGEETSCERLFRRPRKRWEDSIKMDLRRICCEADGTSLVGIMSSDGLWLEPLCSHRILVSSAHYRYKKEFQQFYIYIYIYKFYLIASCDVIHFILVRHSVKSLVGARFPDWGVLSRYILKWPLKTGHYSVLQIALSWIYHNVSVTCKVLNINPSWICAYCSVLISLERSTAVNRKLQVALNYYYMRGHFR